MGWDVVIAGGGFAGLAAAAALAGRGRRIAILEARSDGAGPFRGELVHPHGVATLRALGLASSMERAPRQEILGFALPCSRGGESTLLPYRGAPPAARGMAIEHRVMLGAMREHVASLPGVELREGAAAVAVRRHRGRASGVELSGGEVMTAELTVIADGRSSRLRQQLELPATTSLLSFTAAVALEASVPHPGFGHVFFGAAGPILLYALGDGRARICIDLPRSTSKGRGELVRRLRQSCAAVLPAPLQSALERATDRAAPALCANQLVGTRRCVAPGAALVGDAGGCWHPITATGLTSSLNDAALLARALQGEGSQAAALARYQAERYRFVRLREIFANTLYEVFAGITQGDRSLRSGVLRYLRHSERARTASMALMTGEVSRMGSFAREYLSVFGHAAAGVIAGDASPAIGGEPGGRLLAMLQLLGASTAQVRRNIAPAYRSAGLPALGARRDHEREGRLAG